MVYLYLSVKGHIMKRKTACQSKPLLTVSTKYGYPMCAQKLYMLCWNGSYSSFNCANSSLVLFALFRLYCTLEASRPAFCHAQLSARFRSLPLPATIHLPHTVSLQELPEVATKEKNSLCHQEFYWAQIDYTTLR